MNHINLMDALKAKGADIDGIMERFLRDEAFYADCFEEFMLDGNFETLGKAIAVQDYPQAFECAHALKGVAGNLGLLKLYCAVSDIVSALRAKEYGTLGALYQSVVLEHASFASLLSKENDILVY